MKAKNQLIYDHLYIYQATPFSYSVCNNRKEILNDLSWDNCETKLNFTPYGYTLTRADSNSLLLVGGIVIDSEPQGSPIESLWKATLSEDENDLKWKELKQKLPVKRRNPICFKLQKVGPIFLL